MSESQRAIVSDHEASHGSVTSYTIGFGLSVILTIIAYALVVNHVFRGWGLLYAILGLAVVQLFVQLLFFLHLGRESKPRWNLTVLAFAGLVVMGIVIGSLWIMSNLNYHHVHGTPADTNTFIIHDEGYQQ